MRNSRSKDICIKNLGPLRKKLEKDNLDMTGALASENRYPLVE